LNSKLRRVQSMIYSGWTITNQRAITLALEDEFWHQKIVVDRG
jgi:hypothetical protein